MDTVIDLLSTPYPQSLIDQMDAWLVTNASNLTNEDKDFNLKTGDIITFKNGYDVTMSTKIIGFDVLDGKCYLFWDCYWFGISLKERLISTH